MWDGERVWAVKRLLFAYVKSPSLRHIRDQHSVSKLAQEIVQTLDQGNDPIWTKWDKQRDIVAKAALGCWAPNEDLRDFLNRMPGPPLTVTDVAQRLKILEAESYDCPNEDLQAGCLALYEKEKAAGTDLPAILGVLREHVEREEERLRREREQHYRQLREEERIAREQRLLSGADCNWTQLEKSPHWYSRVNGRTYRLSPSTDKMWNLYRVKSTAEDEKGILLGKYQRRGDATKKVAEMAYQPEPRR
jgi:hypothetical protein